MIPKSFQLCGVTVDVEVVPVEKWPDHDPAMKHCGMYLHERMKVLIRGDLEPLMQQQIWCHETVHAILTVMGHAKNDDEAFVDCFASLLHQVLTSIDKGNKRKRGG